MVIQIDPVSVLDEQYTRGKVERQLRLAFTRFLPMLRQVCLVSCDVPLPNQQCGFNVSIQVYLRGGEPVSVSETHLLLEAAIHRAIDRVTRQLRQKVE